MSLTLRRLALLIGIGSALLIALLWSATILQLRFETERAVLSAIRETDNRAIAYEQYVTRTLEAAEVAAVHLTERFGREPMPAAPGDPPRRLVDRVAENPLFSAVIVADSRGDVRWTTFDAAAPLNVSARPAFRALRAGGTEPLIISKPRLSPILHQPLMSLTFGMRDSDGNFAGTVIIQIAIDRLTDFNQGAATRPQDLISVARSDGITLARRTGQRISYGEDLRGSPILQTSIAGTSGRRVGPIVVDAVPRYLSSHRLERFPAFVTAGVAESDVLAEVRGRRRWYLIGMGALSLAIAAFVLSTLIGLRRQERATEALALANSRLRKAQEIGRIGDWEYDPGTERVRWSPQLCSMYGRLHREDWLTRSEMIARLDPASGEALVQAMDEVLRSGQPRQCEVLLLETDGQQPAHRLLLTPKTDAAGRVTGIIGTEQDVSDEKAHAQLRDEVAHLARVEAVNSMAATIAHELAQPLTAASNYLRGTRAFALRGNPQDMALVHEGLEEVERQIGFAREVMRRAREMVAGGSIVYEEAAVADIVADAVALAKLGHPQAGSRLVLDLAPDADCVAAKRVQVQQVLMNLLRNALEAVANAPDGKVVVTVRRMSGWMIRIGVEDNGPGIAAEVDDIFSPFATSKAGGLGLGLAICRTIIESHRGRIWAERRPEGGTALYFTLPAARRKRPADHPQAA